MFIKVSYLGFLRYPLMRFGSMTLKPDVLRALGIETHLQT